MGRKKGEIPWDYPIVETTAKEGDYIIAPPLEWIENAFKDETTTLIYYGGWMREPGPAESKIETLTGSEVIIPNAMIIPIKSGETVEKGDIILTTWQSGSGMERAIVIGGSPKEPEVLYLDMDYDNPAGIAQEVDKLEPNTFHKLKGGMLEVGGVVAVKDESGSYSRVIATNIAEDRVLTIGFAGKIAVYKKEQCYVLPIRPDVKKGDKVFIPFVGSFQEATVQKVDKKIGRVFTKNDWGNEAAISFGDVTTEFMEPKEGPVEEVKEKKGISEKIDDEKVNKLKKLIKVSKRLKIAKIAEILGMDESKLFDRVIDWADEFEFQIDEDVIEFEGGKKKDFIKKLDEKLAS